MGMFQPHDSPSCDCVQCCSAELVVKTLKVNSAEPLLLRLLARSSSVLAIVCEDSTLVESPENTSSTSADMALKGCLLAIGTPGGKRHLYPL